MIHIDTIFQQVTDQLIKNSKEEQSIDRQHVFQPANMANRELVEQIIEKLLLPGSHVAGYENLYELYQRSQRGESCLILMEHYSNFDIPNLFFLAREHPTGLPVTDAIVAMAGTKLNEESRFVLAFTEAYTRIVIYPGRLLSSMEGTPEYETERARSREINRSALREMVRLKHSGRMILLFPQGTRYRPGKEETKRVLLEVDSYIKGFDHMVFIGIAGNTLEVSPGTNMEHDDPATDVVVYNVSEVTDSAVFRNAARTAVPEGGEQAKRAVGAAVEQRFAELHAEAKEIRRVQLEKLAEKGVAPQRFSLGHDR
ncbi:MAG: 1-acyl-sn-glycerol-3-phosphate acyltransferase [Spirochaeta sp.]|jgi:glycerol-3-phosphate O-acyltransferase|nr:1-acyl-sn-glycerol-3-phosphate acyltransferase [Spirochaeta sp.]